MLLLGFLLPQRTCETWTSYHPRNTNGTTPRRGKLLVGLHELFLLNFQMFMVRHNRQTMKLLDPGLVTLTTLVVLTLLPTSNSELYTALADMEALLETEAVLIDTLHGYIKAQEQRLATLRR
ncbi:hypothetical protein PV326_003579 [Microctonus aethiopoides]|nr:hypothetical protein PV326_003579 [Microctonus aethiopoides]